MTTIEVFLSHFAQPVQEMALKLRAVIREEMPDADERIDSSYQVLRYAVGEKMNDTIAYISAHKDSVNLGFYRGTSLLDPDKLLRGTGKNLRHVKFKQGDTMDTPALRALIAAAWAEDQK